MRIESSTVENHRFGVSRRRGYDSTEVDAVMSRVADTLAQYERMLKRMALPQGQDEITKSVVEAQENKNKLIAKARTAAAKAVDAAAQDATAIRNEATVTADRILGAADDHLAMAQVDAQRIREEADSLIDLATSRADELRSQADMVLTSAIADAEKVREESESVTLTQAAESEKMLHLAQADANRIAAEAAAQSEQSKAGADAEVADILAQARQQAEAMINSAIEETRLIRKRAHTELDELRVSRERHGEDVVSTARNEAAEVRAAAAATAEALAAQGRVDAEDALADARTQALDRLSIAQTQAEDALDHASREAETMMAASREDNRRLERRMVGLREAVTDFEAHIANLAEVAADRAGLITDMIDAELKPLPDSESTSSGAPAVGPRKKRRPLLTNRTDDVSPDGDPVALYAEPDGSGQLPARRPATPPYGDPWPDEIGEPPSALSTEADGPDGFVYDGTEVERQPDFESGIEEGVDIGEATTSTIYQRRGGIKRRVAAATDPQQRDRSSGAG